MSFTDGIVEQRLERPQSEDLVQDLFCQTVSLRRGQPDALLADELKNQR